MQNAYLLYQMLKICGREFDLSFWKYHFLNSPFLNVSCNRITEIWSVCLICLQTYVILFIKKSYYFLPELYIDWWNRITYIFLEADVSKCPVKKLFLKILQNSQVFSCELCKIFKNTYFYITRLAAASVFWPFCGIWSNFNNYNPLEKRNFRIRSSKNIDEVVFTVFSLGTVHFVSTQIYPNN